MALRALVSRVAGGVRCRYQQSIVTSVSPRCLVLPLVRRASTGVNPADCKYLESHEWVSVENNLGTVGISDFAQNELGDIVFVDVPEVGSQVEKGKPFGVVESVKSANDVYSPVSGEVVKVNGDLGSSPGNVNVSPYGEGWMMQVKLSDSSELEKLLDFQQYEKHIVEGKH